MNIGEVTLWGTVLLFVAGFALVVALTAVWLVCADIFRDHELNGWAKAAWLFFLFFAPIVTVLVYVAARGPGLIQRYE